MEMLMSEGAAGVHSADTQIIPFWMTSSETDPTLANEDVE